MTLKTQVSKVQVTTMHVQVTEVVAGTVTSDGGSGQRQPRGTGHGRGGLRKGTSRRNWWCRGQAVGGATGHRGNPPPCNEDGVLRLHQELGEV